MLVGLLVFTRYPEARAIQRKVIFHAGPTNSGKTYHAIQRYLSAKSGVYCGPLKLLAHEIFEKSNNAVCVSILLSTLQLWVFLPFTGCSLTVLITLHVCVCTSRAFHVTWLQGRRGLLWTRRAEQLTMLPVQLKCAASLHLVSECNTYNQGGKFQTWSSDVLLSSHPCHSWLSGSAVFTQSEAGRYQVALSPSKPPSY